MEIRLPRSLDAVGEIFAPVERFCADAGLDSRATFHLKVAAEELFTNLVRHNEGGREYVLLELLADAEQVVVQLTDYDVEPFEIDEPDSSELLRPLAERGEGGLGLHLVKSMVDVLNYTYDGGVLVVRAVRRRGESDVRGHA
jgi:serine/threonine-protein kinase RsbW